MNQTSLHLDQALYDRDGYTEPMQASFFESRSKSAAALDEGFDIEPVAQTGTSIFIFMPTVVIALLYGGIWMITWLAGTSDGVVGRIAFALFVLAPPLLLARAFLKFQSAGLALTDDDLLVAPGWPHHTGIEVAIDSVNSVVLKSSRLAKLFGAADLRVTLKDGTLIKIPDLDRPERLVRLIAARIGQGEPSQK